MDISKGVRDWNCYNSSFQCLGINMLSGNFSDDLYTLDLVTMFGGREEERRAIFHSINYNNLDINIGSITQFNPTYFSVLNSPLDAIAVPTSNISTNMNPPYAFPITSAYMSILVNGSRCI